MPTRLAGAKARFNEKLRARSLTGQIRSVQGDDLVVFWEIEADPPAGGLCDVVAFANGCEYTFRVSTLGGERKKGVFRVVSDLKEFPMSQTIRLLSRSAEAVCRLGEQESLLTIVATNKDSFAFESTDVLPMDEKAAFALKLDKGEVPLDAELILQRFEAGRNRGLAVIHSFSRLADMHWLRLNNS